MAYYLTPVCPSLFATFCSVFNVQYTKGVHSYRILTSKKSNKTF